MIVVFEANLDFWQDVFSNGRGAGGLGGESHVDGDLLEEVIGSELCGKAALGFGDGLSPFATAFGVHSVGVNPHIDEASREVERVTIDVVDDATKKANNHQDE